MTDVTNDAWLVNMIEAGILYKNACLDAVADSRPMPRDIMAIVARYTGRHEDPGLMHAVFGLGQLLAGTNGTLDGRARTTHTRTHRLEHGCGDGAGERFVIKSTIVARNGYRADVSTGWITTNDLYRMIADSDGADELVARCVEAEYSPLAGLSRPTRNELIGSLRAALAQHAKYLRNTAGWPVDERVAQAIQD